MGWCTFAGGGGEGGRGRGSGLKAYYDNRIAPLVSESTTDAGCVSIAPVSDRTQRFV